MLRSFVLAVLLASPRAADPSSGPVVRVDAGEARLVEGQGVRVLDRRSGGVELTRATGWVEAGAGSEVVLCWRGFASATLHGPSAFQLGREPALLLDEVQVLELEVRRGKFAFELADVGSLELGAGALQLRTLPDGVVEFLNRGGATLELRRPEQGPLKIAAGQRLRVRSHRATLGSGS